MSGRAIWPVLAAVSTGLGSLGAERFGPGAGFTAFGCGVGALALRGFARSTAIRRACLGVCVAAISTGLMQRALDGVAHHSLQEAVAASAAVEVRGVLVDDPVASRYDATALLRVDTARVSGGSWRGVHRVVLLRARSRLRGAIAALNAADEIELSGDLHALRGFDQRTRWKHAVAVVDVYAVADVGKPRGVWRVADGLRTVVLRGVEPLPAAERALLGGFLLGDTREIDEQTSAQFRTAGMSHLLAVSGANVAFVLSLAAPLLRRSRLGIRTVAAIALVLLFAAMTRFEPSVLRASVMAIVTLLAQFSGRSVAPLRALSYTIIALLWIDPFLVHSVGFQLSVGACFGIALLARPIARCVPGPNVVKQTVAVSVAAQVGVLPVVSVIFGGVAWVAPAANLFAVPLAEPITVLGLPLAALAGLWRPCVVLLTPVVWALRIVMTIARVANTAPTWLLCAALLTIALAAVTSTSTTVDSAP